VAVAYKALGLSSGQRVASVLEPAAVRHHPRWCCFQVAIHGTTGSIVLRGVCRRKWFRLRREDESGAARSAEATVALTTSASEGTHPLE
jgi:hypothetical protein